MDVLILFLVGSVAGFINVMAGGGSLLTLPTMVFLGLEGPVANGTNRVAILAQNISATIGFFRKGFSDFKLSLTLALCSVPGAALGAYLGTFLRGTLFNLVLAAVMLWVMIVMAASRRRKKTESLPDDHPESAEPPADRPISGGRMLAAHLLMLAAGFYGGFIQAGVGFIMMAILHRVLGLDLVRVNMHKVFIIGVFMIVALAIFAAHGKVLWGMAIALAAGNSVGGYIGSHVSVVRGEKTIRIFLNTILAVMIVKLLVDTFLTNQ